jgi:hypothetical protein
MRSNFRDGRLYVYFDGTEPKAEAWLSNFMFLKKPYRNMEEVWFVHSGFLSRWEGVKDDFKKLITDEVKEILIEGLSQGGAVAVLAHEYVWFRFPVLRSSLKTFTYGSPRCLGFFGFNRIKERFSSLARIKNRGDFVCDLPPVILGYTHAGKEFLQGKFTLDIRKSHGSYIIGGL